MITSITFMGEWQHGSADTPEQAIKNRSVFLAKLLPSHGASLPPRPVASGPLLPMRNNTPNRDVGGVIALLGAAISSELRLHLSRDKLTEKSGRLFEQDEVHLILRGGRTMNYKAGVHLPKECPFPHNQAQCRIMLRAFANILCPISSIPANGRRDVPHWVYFGEYSGKVFQFASSSS